MVIETIEPGSFSRCTEKGQEAIVKSHSKGNSSWIRGEGRE